MPAEKKGPRWKIVKTNAAFASPTLLKSMFVKVSDHEKHLAFIRAVSPAILASVATWESFAFDVNQWQELRLLRDDLRHDQPYIVQVAVDGPRVYLHESERPSLLGAVRSLLDPARLVDRLSR